MLQPAYPFDWPAESPPSRAGSGRERVGLCDGTQWSCRFDAPGLAGDAFASLQRQVNLRRFEPCGWTPQVRESSPGARRCVASSRAQSAGVSGVRP